MRSSMRIASVSLVCILVVCGQVVCGGDTAALMKTATEGKGVARRRAARKIIAMGAVAKAEIITLTEADDIVIKRAALRRVVDIFGPGALPALKRALADSSALVRLVAAEELVNAKPRSKAVRGLLMAATKDKDLAVRQVAASAFWSFHRDVVPLRKRADWDHAIEVVARKPLPVTGWMFRTDPGQLGHVDGWFGPRLDETRWHAIEVGKFWHDALPKKVGHFEGIGWYRTTVLFPEKPAGEFHQVVLHFEANDESTWVWLNGTYAGQHDIGPSGWRTPCDIEIGPFVKWGQPNQITVRILNTAGAGGIWKPAEFQVLK
ncbi:MAG: hypothetical protein KAI66_18975 [Lentisphaeria bacterium]|nr:hypothetical protein [Lentisphaeria bacterium]